MAQTLRLTVVAENETLDALSRQYPGAVVAYAPLPDTVAAAAAFEADTTGDLALVEWDALRAPLFGAVCARYREAGRPSVALCALREEGPAAVLAGADASVLTPYPLAELQAALVAHRRVARPPEDAPAKVRAGDVEVGLLRVDDRRKRVTVGGVAVVLTPRLYDLLSFLAHRTGEVVCRDALLAGVWGLGFDPATNTVDVYVHYLRRALRPVGLAGSVVTVRGRGYVFEVPDAGP